MTDKEEKEDDIKPGVEYTVGDTVNGVKMNLPNQLEDEWIAVKQESIEFDRASYVLEQFKNDYPDIEVGEDIKLVYSLCSRSTALNTWLASVNLKFSDYTQLPLYLSSLIEPTKFKVIKEEISEVRKIVASSSSKRLDAAKKYQAEIAKIDKEEASLLQAKKKDNPILKVLTMNSTRLPLSLQLQIEKYVPTVTDDEAASRKVYAREMLIQYKIGLIKMIKQKPDIDIEAIIKSNETK